MWKRKGHRSKYSGKISFQITFNAHPNSTWACPSTSTSRIRWFPKYPTKTVPFLQPNLAINFTFHQVSFFSTLNPLNWLSSPDSKPCTLYSTPWSTSKWRMEFQEPRTSNGFARMDIRNCWLKNRFWLHGNHLQAWQLLISLHVPCKFA